MGNPNNEELLMSPFIYAQRAVDDKGFLDIGLENHISSINQTIDAQYPQTTMQVPVMTTATRDKVSPRVNGMMILNDDTNKPQMVINDVWTDI